MTYFHKITLQPSFNLDHVRTFMRDYGSAVANTAYKLGGPAASARAFLLSEAVGHTLRLTRAQRSQLIDLHRLLTLQHVCDPDRIESGLFAEIDPSSAFVEDCCCLADKLDALLVLIAEEKPVSEVHEQPGLAISKVA